MKTKVVIKSVQKLTEREQRLCLKHNLREMGTMEDKLEELLYSGEKAKVGILWGIKQNKKPVFIGWFLLCHPRNKPSIDTYVRPKYRHQGYGSKLVVAAQRDRKRKRIKVEPWSKEARGFYARCQSDCRKFRVSHFRKDEWQEALTSAK